VTDVTRLEYDFTTDKRGLAKVFVYCIPTHMIHAGVMVRYAVSIDGGQATCVDLETKKFSPQWSEHVLHATAIGNSEHQITAGNHTLTLRPLDPGMVFDKIAISVSP
jgi:hypothetical protein